MTDDYCYLYDGKPFTGIGELIHENHPILEMTYLNGSRTGLCRQWDVDEHYLKRESCYAANAYHGMVESWFVSGTREKLACYEHGICTMEICWNEGGEMTAVFSLTDTDPLFTTLQQSRKLYPAPEFCTETTARNMRLEDELKQLMQTVQ